MCLKLLEFINMYNTKRADVHKRILWKYYGNYMFHVV